MTRAEIKRHAAAILALRARKMAQRRLQAVRDRGFLTVNDFNARKRRAYGATCNDADELGRACVDQMFEARQRAGWLPRVRDV